MNRPQPTINEKCPLLINLKYWCQFHQAPTLPPRKGETWPNYEERLKTTFDYLTTTAEDDLNRMLLLERKRRRGEFDSFAKDNTFKENLYLPTKDNHCVITAYIHKGDCQNGLKTPPIIWLRKLPHILVRCWQDTKATNRTIYVVTMDILQICLVNLNEFVQSKFRPYNALGSTVKQLHYTRGEIVDATEVHALLTAAYDEHLHSYPAYVVHKNPLGEAAMFTTAELSIGIGSETHKTTSESLQLVVETPELAVADSELPVETAKLAVEPDELAVEPGELAVEPDQLAVEMHKEQEADSQIMQSVIVIVDSDSDTDMTVNKQLQHQPSASKVAQHKFVTFETQSLQATIIISDSDDDTNHVPAVKNVKRHHTAPQTYGTPRKQSRHKQFHPTQPSTSASAATFRHSSTTIKPSKRLSNFFETPQWDDADVNAESDGNDSLHPDDFETFLCQQEKDKLNIIAPIEMDHFLELSQDCKFEKFTLNAWNTYFADLQSIPRQAAASMARQVTPNRIQVSEDSLEVKKWLKLLNPIADRIDSVVKDSGLTTSNVACGLQLHFNSTDRRYGSKWRVQQLRQYLKIGPTLCDKLLDMCDKLPDGLMRPAIMQQIAETHGEGDVSAYVGVTQLPFPLRMSQHRTKHRNAQEAVFRRNVDVMEAAFLEYCGIRAVEILISEGVLKGTWNKSEGFDHTVPDAVTQLYIPCVKGNSECFYTNS